MCVELGCYRMGKKPTKIDNHEAGRSIFCPRFLFEAGRMEREEDGNGEQGGKGRAGGTLASNKTASAFVELSVWNQNCPNCLIKDGFQTGLGESGAFQVADGVDLLGKSQSLR